MLNDLLVKTRLRKPVKSKRMKYTHDLLCECRKCNPSINTYVRKMNQ
jgi:hypothetical protein